MFSAPHRNLGREFPVVLCLVVLWFSTYPCHWQLWFNDNHWIESVCLISQARNRCNYSGPGSGRIYCRLDLLCTSALSSWAVWRKGMEARSSKASSPSSAFLLLKACVLGLCLCQRFMVRRDWEWNRGRGSLFVWSRLTIESILERSISRFEGFMILEYKHRPQWYELLNLKP